MHRLTVALLFATLFLASSCRKDSEPQQANPTPGPAPAHALPAPAQHNGVVQEVLQATEYTYLHLQEAEQTYWIAIQKQDLQVGDKVSFNGGLEMRDFTSKDLDRTFDRVLFVDQLVGGQAAPAVMAGPHGAPMSSGKPVLAKETISIQPVAGGTTIGELFGNRDRFADRTVLVKGKVTKINRGIMGRNWIHLQDGTESNGEFDLTLTTQDVAEVGDIAVFEGTVALNRDFGAGYKYDVIMENAQRKTE
jgi:hypothetical protein